MRRVLNRDVFILVTVCVVSMAIGATLARAGSTNASSASSTRVITVTNANGASSATPLPTSTVTVTDTTTKTVTKQAAASTGAPAQTSSGSYHGKVAYTFSGNGGTTLAPFRVWHPATLQWTNTGQLFQLFTTDSVLVNSQASSGSTYLAPESYTIQVNGIGSWTLKVVYR